jgi:hypothetical protein
MPAYILHTKIFLLFCLVILLIPLHLLAQQPYKPLRINEKIMLDGKLNEFVWKEAAVEDDFMQYDPSAGAAPSEKTEVRIVYNDEYLFVGLRAYDHEPLVFPDEFSDDGNALFKNHLLRVNLAYFFSSKVSVKLLSQFDGLSNQVTSNLRVRYNPGEGTDLYIVFNQGLNTDRTRLTPHLPVVDEQAVTVKFIKTFDVR